MDDDGKGVHGLAVQQHVEPHEVARPVFEELVVERRVTARDRLQLVVEVENDLCERELPAELDPGGVDVVHPPVHAPSLLAQLHDGPDVLRRGDDAGLDVWLFDVIDLRAVWHQAGILDQVDGAVRAVDVILHVRHGADQIEVEFSLEPLAHDFHMEQAEEPAAKAEPERHRRLRLVMQRRIVELQLPERIAQLLELLGIRRVQAGEHHRLDVAVARQQREVAIRRVEHCVPRARLAHAPDVGDEVPDFPGLELLDRLVPELEVADFVHLVHVVLVGPERDLHAGPEHAVHHADAGDRAAVAVVIRIEDQRAERGFVIAPRRRHPPHDGFQQFGDAGALLGGDAQDLLGLRPDELVQLLRAAVRLGAGQVDLVEYRDDLEASVESQKQVGQGLRLNSLGGVHHQDCPLARLQRARNLIGKVHVPGRVDQVELVHASLSVAGVVVHAHRVKLDRDAPFALQIHGVEHLFPHQALVERPGELDEPVGQRRFPVVDVGHDAEVADVVLAHRGRNIDTGY